MKTVTKIIIITALVLFAAIKMFAGGGVSKEANRATEHKATINNYLLTQAAIKGDAKELEAALANAEKDRSYSSKELSFKNILNHAVFNNRADCVARLSSFIIRVMPNAASEIMEEGLDKALQLDRKSCIDVLVPLLKPKKEAVAQQLLVATPALPTVLIDLIADYSL